MAQLRTPAVAALFLAVLGFFSAGGAYVRQERLAREVAPAAEPPPVAATLPPIPLTPPTPAPAPAAPALPEGNSPLEKCLVAAVNVQVRERGSGVVGVTCGEQAWHCIVNLAGDQVTFQCAQLPPPAAFAPKPQAADGISL